MKKSVLLLGLAAVGLAIFVAFPALARAKDETVTLEITGMT